MASPRGRNHGHQDFGALLREEVQASLYSYGQLAQLSGVPKRTIVNWLDGTVKHPRHWQSIVRVAAALRLDEQQTNMLLAAAQLPDLASLTLDTHDSSDRSLLEHWQFTPATTTLAGLPLPTPSVHRAFCLLRYMELLAVELSRLPVYFSRHASFNFAAIYQDMRLRRVQQIPEMKAEVHGEEPDGTAWSVLRQECQRAVILGQPGMGKTWLLKAEALNLIAEARTQESNQTWILPLLIRIPDLVALVDMQSSLKDICHAMAQLAARWTPSLPEAEVVETLESFMVQNPDRLAFLLDALDEVPARAGLRSVARHVVMQLGAATRSRLFLTSRTLGYGAAPIGHYLGAQTVEYEVMPFSERAIGRVIRAWFHDRLPQLDRLQQALRRAPSLVRQASNPLLLSLMCLLTETQGEALAANRSGLYEPVLRLLLEGRWRSFDMQLPEGRVRSKLRMLEAIAWCYATYRQGWWEQLPGDVLESMIEGLPETQRLWSTWHDEWGSVYEGPLWELSEWDGVLVKGAVSADGAASAVPYAFLHRTFQEFLVARYLLRRYVDVGLEAPELQEFLTSKSSDPEWYIVLLLLVEQLTLYSMPDAEPLLNHLSDILLNSVQDRSGQMAVAAVEILLNLHITAVDSEVVQALRTRLIATLRNNGANAMIRVHAARLVAELGDPRAMVMQVDGIEFVDVPAGVFWMGSDPATDAETADEELPHHQRGLSSYAISRFPISNAQFRAFIDDKQDGYDNPDYWPEAIALGHWRDGMVLRLRQHYRADGTVAMVPSWAREPNLSGWPTDLPNGPIMGISWYEARAFIRWLEKRWRQSGLIQPRTRLDLPSEAEWEKAARGVDGRIYPWGNEFDGERLNWVGHMLMAPVPIGAFPDSASPFGAEEMIGNLWEWTRTTFAPYADSQQGSQAQGGTDFVNVVMPDVDLVIRGGAYFSHRSRCRCAARSKALPYGRIHATFRIVKYEAADGAG